MKKSMEKRISRSLLTIKRIMSAIRRFLPLSGSRLVMWFCLEYLRRHLWRPFLSNVGLFAIVLFVLAAVALYLILVVSYGLFASGFYQKKHIRAKGRVKRYIRMLTQLDKFYSKERKKKNRVI